MKEEWRIAFAGQPGRKSADRNSEIAIFQGALKAILMPILLLVIGAFVGMTIMGVFSPLVKMLQSAGV